MKIEEFVDDLLEMTDDFRRGKWDRKKWNKLFARNSEIPFSKSEVTSMFFAQLEEKQIDYDHQSIVKTFEYLDQVYNSICEDIVCFSPGNSCRDLIIEQIKSSTTLIEICVFTISDDLISDALVEAMELYNVDVRIITDDEKSYDKGSDIKYMEGKGIPVRYDDVRHHMHHKFAIFDSNRVLTGSYNWTRSAASYNQENILLTAKPKVVEAYKKEFDKLWKSFE